MSSCCYLYTFPFFSLILYSSVPSYSSNIPQLLQLSIAIGHTKDAVEFFPDLWATYYPPIKKV